MKRPSPICLPAPTARGWPAPSAVFAVLPGTWTFERTIAGIATIVGVAQFTLQDLGTCAYRESARVTLADGKELDASRAYLYRAHPEGFDVWFAEDPPRLFHTVRLARGAGALRAETSHLCSQDLYCSRYAFLDDGSFVVDHHVVGPAKHFAITTVYRRSPPTEWADS